MNPPNIVMIFSDEHRYDCTAFGGHPQAHTPHLERIAAAGAGFTHAFTPIPICCPARQSLMCGQWPVTHQGLTNYDNGELRNALSSATPTYAGALRAAGYATHHLGKWHVHPTLGPAHYGFETECPDAAYHQWRAQAGLPSWRAGAGSLSGRVDTVPTEQSWKHWLTDRALELIEARAADGRPFHLRLDFAEPHPPFVVPEPWASRVDPASLTPWGSFAETFAGKPWIQRQMLHHWGIQDWTWEQWAPFVALYLGTIAHIDFQIGRVIEALTAAGMLENTLLVYTADHGGMVGGHRMTDKHAQLYDDVVRVPFFVQWPAAMAPRGRCEEFVCNLLDLPPTFLEAAGAPVPETMQGRSLLPLLRGQAPADWPQAAFASLHGSQFGMFTQRMVRDRRYKYVFNATAIDELYDLEADPHELRNLTPDPAHAPLLAHYRNMLLDWADRIGDPLLTNPFMRTSLAEGRILDHETGNP
jgi:arylsulfatase A-like enzyme